MDRWMDGWVKTKERIRIEMGKRNERKGVNE